VSDSGNIGAAAVALALGLGVAHPVQAQSQSSAAAPAKQADGAKPATAAQRQPATPFDYERPKVIVTGPLPDLVRMDFNQMAELLYAHLLAEADPSRSALIIEAALQRAGKSCQQVSAFQIYRYRTGSRTLKVKCPGKPLYVLTVGSTGGFQISGGDGTIPELVNTDGRIYSLFGREIIVPKEADPAPLTPGATPTSIPTAPAAVQAPAPVPVPAPTATPAQPVVPQAATPAIAEPAATGEEKRFRSWLLIVNGLGLGVILVSLWAYLKSRRKRHDALEWGLTSDDKDLLLEESREIYPNIFQHPQGFFISRGRQGKRRLFRSAFPAILYRDFGLKISEISI
jgi:hypothetical protein